MLGIARSGVYRLPRPANDDDLALLRRKDELFTRRPFLGSRRMTAMLRTEGVSILYPYLLRDITVDLIDQVWAADLTYIPIGGHGMRNVDA